MSPQRWSKLEELYHVARELAPDERNAFLASACGGDNELKRSIEALLAQVSQGGIFDGPAAEFLKSICPGDQLGHYEIIALIGSGGMGEVYKARDPRLQRDIALKVLPSAVGRDPERRFRFVQEARSASALNHPHIITIYDVGQASGVDFIAMELLDGKSLDQLIPRKGMRLGEVLKYAVQIADALSAAHAAGIVHRDIKPGNVMVTVSGLVKVLDFGLAKVIEERLSGQFGNTETMVADPPPRTKEGVILGTVSYMSPEQAQGKKVDARSDIFSFGAVLYEMLSGRRPFRGDSPVSTLAAILHGEPEPVEKVVSGMPHELARIVRRCLRKELDRRSQSMAEIQVALQDLNDESEFAAPEAAPAPSKQRATRNWAALAITGAVISILSVLGTLSLTPKPPPFDILTRVTADRGLTTDPALSPDGKTIAYASDRSGDGSLHIWIQQRANGEAVRLTNDPSDDRQPSFSPDGSTIVFRSERERGGIYTIPSLGGVARLLVSEGYDPKYSPDGKSIAYWTGYAATAFPARSWIYSISGLTRQQIRADFARVTHPLWSPDGKFILFDGSPTLGQFSPSTSYDWWITPVGAGNAVRTGALEYLNNQGLQLPKATAWLPSNEILASASAANATNIWRIPVSRRLHVERRPVRVTLGTQREVRPSAIGDDLLAYAAENSSTEIWSLDLNPGATGGHSDPIRLAGGTGMNIRPSISRDGNTMAYISNSVNGPHVWIKSVQRGSDRALTGGSRQEYWPVLSPDGTKVAFTTEHYPTEAQSRAGVPLLIAEVRTGVPQEVCSNCWRPEDWSVDGHKILLGFTLSSDREIAEFDLAAKKHRILIKDSHRNVVSPRYSPDGKWVSFQEVTGPDTRQLWIAPLDESVLPVPPSRWIAITDNTTVDREARWSEDGTWLYFASNRDGFQCLWAQRLDPSSKHPTRSAMPIHHFHSGLLGLTLTDSGDFGMSVGAGRMVVSLGATTGNIWLMRRP